MNGQVGEGKGPQNATVSAGGWSRPSPGTRHAITGSGKMISNTINCFHGENFVKTGCLHSL